MKGIISFIRLKRRARFEGLTHACSIPHFPFRADLLLKLEIFRVFVFVPAHFWRAAALVVALLASTNPAVAREKITMWFWGATPAYRQALQNALVTPYNNSQTRYELVIEYRATVDNDVRVAVMGGGGPDLIYTSGPSDVTPLARAGKLAPLDVYAARYGWNRRLLKPVLDTCRQFGRLYCVPPSLEADGLFYNKAVLKAHGWSVPTDRNALISVMRAAQAQGLYASVTGNKGWQPVDEDYASIFLNQMVGPSELFNLLEGKGDWVSPEMLAAISTLNQWFQAGYLGGSDYFDLDFDHSLVLLHDQRAPFIFAPTMLLQWVPNYFTDTEADDLGFEPFPRMRADLPYPIYDIGVSCTFSINANSKVKDGAAAVLDRMMSAEFALKMAKVWPGYWAIPLVDFPINPGAIGIEKLYDDSITKVISAIKSGNYGYSVDTFFPPATADVFDQDLEAVWVNEETPRQMLEKAGRVFAGEESAGIAQQFTRPALSNAK
jgi:raffinose/stachyose/melibiose transport system substrate-binding protein